jgi:uroporphyrinogen decarboxylase
MRQAGRSLPEYRALRRSHDVLALCSNPELAVEVTLQPVRRFGVDAAILFSDIVVPLRAMGVDVEIRPGVGPVIEKPVRSRADVERLAPLVPEEGVPFVLEAVRMLTRALDVPLIGFAGAPFTLACYLIEGGPSRTHARTRALMLSDPATWAALMEHLAEATVSYLSAQVGAGADALQLFDSWVGGLAPADFERSVLPYVKRIFQGIAPLGVPTIYFGLHTSELLDAMARSGASALSIDHRVPLDVARARTGGMPLQGNLDPAALLAPPKVLEAAALDVLRRGGGRGHVFNLGHGVLPATEPGQLERLVDLVQSWRPA